MQTYNDDAQSLPQFIVFNNVIDLVTIASASFYRNVLNENIEIYIPTGIQNNDLYLAPDTYLPHNIFNEKNEKNNIKFVNNKDALIQYNSKCLHNISIQFKLTKMDGTNYANQRECRITLVDNMGLLYNESIMATNQPDTGQHVTTTFNATIKQRMADIVRIKINIIQDNTLNDVSDTKLTIFNISWNIQLFKYA